MTSDYETILERALELTNDERARLIDELEASYSDEYLEKIERTWLDEALARADQIDRNEADLVPDSNVRPGANSPIRDDEDGNGVT